MKLRTIGHSTKSDYRGRVFLPALVRRRAGLKPGPIEFFENDMGELIIRNASFKKNSHG